MGERTAEQTPTKQAASIVLLARDAETCPDGLAVLCSAGVMIAMDDGTSNLDAVDWPSADGVVVVAEQLSSAAVDAVAERLGAAAEHAPIVVLDTPEGSAWPRLRAFKRAVLLDPAAASECQISVIQSLVSCCPRCGKDQIKPGPDADGGLDGERYRYLFDSLKDLNDRLECRIDRRTRQLQFLQNVAFAANLAENVTDAVGYALMRACGHFGWLAGWAYTVGPDDRTVEVMDVLHLSDYDDPVLRPLRDRDDRQAACGIARTVLEAGRTVTLREPRELPGTRLSELLEQGHAIAAYPVTLGNELLAVLAFLMPCDAEVDERTQDVLGAVAAQLGSLIHRKQAESRLRSSEARLRAIFDNAAIGIAVVEAGYHGRVVRANKVLGELVGQLPEALLGESLTELIHSDDRDRFFCGYNGLDDGKAFARTEVRLVGRDDVTRWGRLTGSLLPDGAGGSTVVVWLIEDISDRKRAENDLLRVSLSLEHACEGIAHIGADGCYIAVNRAYAEMLGTLPSKLIGESWETGSVLWHPAEAGRARAEVIGSGRASFAAQSLENGTASRYFQVSLHRAAEASEGFYCFLADVTECRRLEREVIDAVVDRQRRIGLELQEGLVQHLAGMRMMARALERLLVREKSSDAVCAETFVDLLADAQQQAKAVIKGLRPVEVDAAGLMSALEELAVATERRYDRMCRFECADEVLVDDNNTATQLYYIARDAISNAVERLAAQALEIDLRRRADRLSLTVRAAGTAHGCGPEFSDGTARIMQYRAGLIGAQLEFESADGGGWSVVCTL